jgi:hypothetical protein
MKIHFYLIALVTGFMLACSWPCFAAPARGFILPKWPKDLKGHLKIVRWASGPYMEDGNYADSITFRCDLHLKRLRITGSRASPTAIYTLRESPWTAQGDRLANYSYTTMNDEQCQVVDSGSYSSGGLLTSNDFGMLSIICLGSRCRRWGLAIATPTDSVRYDGTSSDSCNNPQTTDASYTLYYTVRMEGSRGSYVGKKLTINFNSKWRKIAECNGLDCHFQASGQISGKAQ